MPKTQIGCPNCRKPVVAEINRLFDTKENPTAKQLLLSGSFNFIHCPHCGYQGQAAVPIVYHDPDKELLLTFVPSNLGLPRDEQERAIGSIINTVVNHLPQEKRKAYLLQPQSSLTLQGLIEQVLEADGITREMIQAQQEKLNLIEQLVDLNEKQLKERVKLEDEKIDAEFFAILQRLAEAALVGGDQVTAEKLNQLYRNLLPITKFGKEIQNQTREIESAIKDLQSLGQEINREKMLELVINAPNEIRLRALVSLARPVFDYQFFQLLSERIDRARSDGRLRLVNLRSQLLEMTQEVDKQVELIAQEKRRLVDTILGSPNYEEQLEKYLPAVDEYFIAELERRLELARKQGNLESIAKIQKILDLIRESTKQPPELELIEELLELNDDASVRNYLDEHAQEITPEFVNLINSIVVQAQSGGDQQLVSRMREINRQVLRLSMEKNLQ